mgnify:CR=1 FL=1
MLPGPKALQNGPQMLCVEDMVRISCVEDILGLPLKPRLRYSQYLATKNIFYTEHPHHIFYTEHLRAILESFRTRQHETSWHFKELLQMFELKMIP